MLSIGNIHFSVNFLLSLNSWKWILQDTHPWECSSGSSGPLLSQLWWGRPDHHSERIHAPNPCLPVEKTHIRMSLFSHRLSLFGWASDQSCRGSWAVCTPSDHSHTTSKISFNNVNMSRNWVRLEMGFGLVSGFTGHFYSSWLHFIDHHNTETSVLSHTAW